MLQIVQQPDYSGNLIFSVQEANKGLSVGRAVKCAAFCSDNSLSCEVNSRDHKSMTLVLWLPLRRASMAPCHCLNVRFNWQNPLIVIILHIHIHDIRSHMCNWGNKQVLVSKGGFVGITTQSHFREAVLRLLKCCTSYLCWLQHGKTVATTLWHILWKIGLRKNKCFGIQLGPAGLKYLPTALDNICGA